MFATEPALLTPWIQYARPVPGARLILLCFPHAGGAASVFREWSTGLADRGVEVWPVQPPGRETRYAEAPLVDLSAMTKILTDAIAPQLGDRPYAVFGHSAGSFMAYAFARYAVESGRPAPVHLFLSACRPPQHPDPDFPVHRLAHDAFLARLFGYGRVPPEVMQYPDLAEMMISLTRSDLQLVETYVWPDDPALDCPVTAFGGVADATVPVDVLPDWSVVTTDDVETIVLPGGHFPPPEGEQRVREVVRRALSGY